MWVDLPGVFPLARDATNASGTTATPSLRLDDKGDALLQRHQADLLLLSLVLLFLVSSYLVCRFCRCRRRHAANVPSARSYAYTRYHTSASGTGTLRNVVAETKKKPKTVLVSEMEEPFLGPPDYAQPPPYEMSPPAYEYLPSAPPLSEDASHHSPR